MKKLILALATVLVGVTLSGAQTTQVFFGTVDSISSGTWDTTQNGNYIEMGFIAAWNATAVGSQSIADSIKFQISVIYTGVSYYAPSATGSASFTTYDSASASAYSATAAVTTSSSANCYSQSASNTATDASPDPKNEQNSPYTPTIYGNGLAFEGSSGDWEADESFITISMSASASATGTFPPPPPPPLHGPSSGSSSGGSVVYYTPLTNNLTVTPNNGI